MNISSTNVEKYYRDNFSKLSYEKQFHFASRLFLFSKKIKCKKEIANLNNFYVWNPQDVQNHIDDIIDKNELYIDKIINNRKFRTKTAQKYPLLGSYNNILFKLLFQKTIYCIDYSEYLINYKQVNILHDYYTKIISDSYAIFNLSTHAINFIFLYENLFTPEKPVLIKNLIDISQKYSLNNRHDTLQSQVYLLTHIIICKSLFYSIHIPKNSLKSCTTAFHTIEEILINNYNIISLDQKLEFLVCGIILNKETSLKSKILGESKNSKSQQGCFIIDTKSNMKNFPHLQTFEGSEHRNILYILTNYKYL